MTVYEHYTYFCPTCWQPLTEDVEARITAPKGKCTLTPIQDLVDLQTDSIMKDKKIAELERKIAILEAEAAFRTFDHGDD